jgi:NADH-quinone oxidoreductase subunit J
MTLPVVLFALVAALTAGSALGVVFSRSVVRAAVWLLFCLIGVSLIYFLLGAEFLGAAQLILYVGGTLVLVVFGVMLTSQGPFDGPRTRPAEWVVGGLLAGALFALLATISLDLGRPTPTDQPLPGVGPLGLTFLGVPEQPGDTQGLAFLLPFEIVSVHLLVVLIAAAYLARAKKKVASPSPQQPGVK